MHALQTIHLFTNVYITRKHAQKKRKKTKQISFSNIRFLPILLSVSHLFPFQLFLTIFQDPATPPLQERKPKPLSFTLSTAQLNSVQPLQDSPLEIPVLNFEFSRQKHQQHSGDPNAGNSVLGFHSKGYRSMVFVWAQFIRSYKLCSLL